MKWDEIINQLPIDFVRRMRNWQRAAVGMAGSGRITNYAMFGMPTSDAWHTHAPTLIGEATDTEHCLGLVPIRYQQAVRVFWAYEGISMRAMAVRIMPSTRSKLDRKTAEAWLNSGHDLLQAELARYIDACRLRAIANAEAVLMYRTTNSV